MRQPRGCTGLVILGVSVSVPIPSPFYLPSLLLLPYPLLYYQILSHRPHIDIFAYTFPNFLQMAAGAHGCARTHFVLCDIHQS